MSGSHTSEQGAEQAGRHIAPARGGSYPRRAGNRVQLLIDGVCAFSTIADAVRAARSSVWVTVAFLQQGFAFPCGSGFFELLGAAAARGVDVRALLWRCWATERSEPGEHFPGTPQQLAELRERGAALRIRWDRSLGGYCQHQKSWLIDAGQPGEVAFVGGINLDRDSLARPGHTEPGGSTHDLYASLQGPCASDVHHGFVQRWNSASERALPGGCWPSFERCGDLEPPRRISPAAGGLHVQVQRTLPAGQSLLELPGADGAPALREAEFAIREQILGAIGAARSLVYLENQAVLSLALVRALHAALARGVRVILLAPLAAFPEVAAARSAPEQREFFERFAALGAHPAFLMAGLAGPREERIHVHSKLLLVDDAWLTIGSANAMDRSFERDTELNLAVWSTALARGFGRSLVEEFTGAAVAAGADPWAVLSDAARAQGSRRGLLRALAPERYALGA